MNFGIQRGRERIILLSNMDTYLDRDTMEYLIGYLSHGDKGTMAQVSHYMYEVTTSKLAWPDRDVACGEMINEMVNAHYDVKSERDTNICLRIHSHSNFFTPRRQSEKKDTMDILIRNEYRHIIRRHTRQIRGMSSEEFISILFRNDDDNDMCKLAAMYINEDGILPDDEENLQLIYTFETYCIDIRNSVLNYISEFPSYAKPSQEVSKFLNGLKSAVVLTLA